MGYAPPFNKFVSVLETSRLLHCLQDLQNAESPTPSKVVSLIPRLGRAIIEDFRMVGESVECEEMARGEVEDVQIVTNTGTVAIHPHHKKMSVCEEKKGRGRGRTH